MTSAPKSLQQQAETMWTYHQATFIAATCVGGGRAKALSMCPALNPACRSTGLAESKVPKTEIKHSDE